MKSLKLTKKDLPVRPGFGTQGREVKLRTNFFAVKVPKGPLYEYDIQIKPEPSTNGLRRRIIELAETAAEWTSSSLPSRVAHDYASRLISADELALPVQIKVSLPEDAQGAAAEPRPTQSKHRGKGGKKSVRPNEYTLSLHLVHELETQSLAKYVLSFLSAYEHVHIPEHALWGVLKRCRFSRATFLTFLSYAVC